MDGADWPPASDSDQASLGGQPLILAVTWLLGLSYRKWEFNVYADPEAAAIVFDAWPGLTLISWETTMDHCLWIPMFHHDIQMLG